MAKRNIDEKKLAKVTGSAATLVADVLKTLNAIQDEMYAKALADRDGHIGHVDTWADFSPCLNKGNLVRHARRRSGPQTREKRRSRCTTGCTRAALGIGSDPPAPSFVWRRQVLVPFCGDPKCEEMIKEKTKMEAMETEVEGGMTMGAKSLCVPHEDVYQTACP